MSAERWLARDSRVRRLGPRHALVAAGVALTALVVVPQALPAVPIADVHLLPPDKTVNDSIGWPQLVAEVAAQNALLTKEGHAPTAIYTGAYAEAGALLLYGGPDHLPPVVSAHNSFYTWGPGTSSDTTVLVVDALSQVRPYFASCRQLAVFNPPDQVQNDWNNIPIGVCTGPSASWTALWSHLKHYD